MAESGLRKPAPLSFEGNVSENWRIFEEEFEIYSNAILYEKPDKVKAYTLLNLAGQEAIQRSKLFEYQPEVRNANDQITQAAETKEQVDVLITKFRELCNPQKNVSMERHIFFTRDQKQGESMNAYITDLKQKASSCEFEHIKDSLIRDRFISGVNSEPLRRVLLKEKNLTLNRVIELAQLDELTQSRLKQFSSNKEIHMVKTRPRHHQNPHSRKPMCGNCGESHTREEKCRAKGYQCFKCKKFNHFPHICRSYPDSSSSHHAYDKPWSHSKHPLPHNNAPHKHVYEYDVAENISADNEECFVIDELETGKIDFVHV